MRAFAGLVAIVLALGTGYYMYSLQVAPGPAGEPAVGQLEAVAVRSDLLSIAQAERNHAASYGTYATLEQLRKSAPNLPLAGRGGYSYDVEIDGARHFIVTARPGENQTGLPTVTIDETMTVRP